MASDGGAFDLAGKRIWVAGHRGMVGGAVVRRLAQEPCQVLTVGRDAVDLRRQGEVEDWMAANKPDAVVLAAATVGGIVANDSRPADFLYDNLVIETAIIHAAWQTGVRKLLFLGSSCIYPRDATQPLTESALLTGPLEATNEWYAIAKIAGIKLCQAYRRQHGCDGPSPDARRGRRRLQRLVGAKDRRDEHGDERQKHREPQHAVPSCVVNSARPTEPDEQHEHQDAREVGEPRERDRERKDARDPAAARG